MIWRDLFKQKEELAGFAFGLTSGIVTTLGVLVGVLFATESKLAVVAAVATVAVADAFSDAFGIHTSKETEDRSSKEAIWSATLSTFWAKLLIGLIFILIILLFSQLTALVISLLVGFFFLTVFGWWTGGKRGEGKRNAIEHLVLGIVVVTVAFLLGELVKGVS